MNPIGQLTSCAGKHRYPSFSAANKHRKRPGSFDTADVYHCQYCGGYHIGHALITRARRAKAQAQGFEMRGFRK